MAGPGTPATMLLDRCGVRYRLHCYSHDFRASSYEDEAADAPLIPDHSCLAGPNLVGIR